MPLSRRHFLAGALSAPVIVRFASPAAATAAVPSGQVLPVQQIRAGEAVVSAISDGYLDLDLAALSNIDTAEANRLLEAAFQDEPPVTTGVNAYVVHLPDRTVLVDTGAADAFPETGRLADRLETAGFAPAAIDDVLMTHLHPDHVGGLVRDGQPAFPNATVHVHQAEYDFWTSTERSRGEPEGFAEAARDALEVTGDRVQTFSGEGEVVPGITARELFGHTPGHTGYMVGEGEESLLIWGDIVHMAPVQLPRPEVGIAFDVNGEQAIETRRRLLAEVAENRTRIAGMHIAFPGVGHVRQASTEGSYAFVPSDWTYALGKTGGSE